jgi:protein disulfide-isomerase A6
VFAFLPPLPDTTAKDRAAAVDALTTAAGGFAGRPFGWAWAAGGDLADLEAALGVGGYGFPAVVAVVPGDAPRVAHMKGGYGAAEIKRFVERARGGGAAAAPVSGALATAATVAPWDGKDAPAGAAVEDEFSLDDIMNEL